MGLTVPSTGVTAGPLYANEINNDLAILDAHNHTLGSGVQITPAALNINTALSMQDNSLTFIESLQFQAQTSVGSLATLYVIGLDLYYNDGNGNVVRITNNGSIVGPFGTITGLPSGTASASYISGTFVFQAANNTAANIDGASYILRNSTANSFGLTLSAPNSLAGDYSLVLPSIPSQTNVMTLDTSGNMSSITYDAVGQDMSAVGANAIAASMNTTGTNSIIATMGAAGAQQIATNMGTTGANTIAANRTRPIGSAIGDIANTTGCGVFVFTSTTNVAVTNQTVTLTTSGRPIMITFGSDGGNGSGQASFVSANGTGMNISIINTTGGYGVIAQYFETNYFGVGGGALNMPASLVGIDFAPAGTHTYTVYVNSPTGAAQSVNYCRLNAFEL